MLVEKVAPIAMLARWTMPARRSRITSTRSRRRFYYVESLPTEDPRVLKMAMRGDNGKFRFDICIYNLQERDSDSPLVIYLSDFPSDRFRWKYKGKQVALDVPNPLVSRFRVAVVNYRWSPNHWFPGPIHDVLSAYDSIVKILCTPKTRIGVYGRYMGGTLATSLALTECNNKKPGSISALATESALLDWSQFATDAPIPENYPSICLLGDNERSIAATKLRETSVILRNLFSSPAECYDPFASPILFFRNPAQNVPEEFYNIEPIDPWPSFEHISSYPNLQTHRSGRRALVRFPPRESDLVIPKAYIISTRGPEMEQGLDLVKCMRRSIVMYGDNGDRESDATKEAENRVQFVLKENPTEPIEGLSKQNQERENEMLDWLEQSLHN